MSQDTAPPRIATLIVRLLLPREIREEVLGDLEERFRKELRRARRATAVSWYWGQVRALRPRALRSASRSVAIYRKTFRSTRWGDGMRGSWGMDFRHAVRRIGARRRAAATVILTIALAIGATTSVFTVVNGVLLRPLPFPEPDELISLWQTKRGWMDSPNAQLRLFSQRLPLAIPTFHDWVDQSREFEALGLYAGRSWVLRGAERPEILRGATVTSGLFEVLGVEPILGRRILPEDDRPGAEGVAVLAHSTWQGRFGEDPNVLGRVLQLGADSYRIIGVMPAGFAFPTQGTMWTSLSEAEKARDRGSQGYNAIGRLSGDATAEAALAEIEAIQARLAEAYPDDQGDHGARLVPYVETVVGDVESTLWFLLGTVGLVLIIACVNIANMLSVLGLSRQRELAVRSALGAGWGGLARIQMAEALVLAGVGGLAGVGLAVLAQPIFANLLPSAVPRQSSVVVDGMVLLVGFGLTMATTLVVGLLPSLQAGRIDPARTMGESGRAVTENRAGRGVRNILVSSEVALAFVLLLGAALLGNSFMRLWSVDRGFESEGLLVAWVQPDAERFPETADRHRFLAQLRERLDAIPGTVVSATNQVPLEGSTSTTSYSLERTEGEPDTVDVLISVVLENYFDLMQIPVNSGRGFTLNDRADAPLVAIVNEAMAEAYWPGMSPIGRRLRSSDNTGWISVVGVVGDVRHHGLAVEVEPKLYVPASQTGRYPGTWVLRSTGDLTGVLDLFRESVHAVSPDTPVRGSALLDETISASVAVPRLRAGLVIGLAVMAAFLALIGVYGVVGFAVSQRTKEIGVRMALGSGPNEVVRRILGKGLRVTAAGLMVGVLIAVPAARLVSDFLFEIQPTDPTTFTLTAALVSLVSLMAAYLPARRAARVDPVTVLKAE